MKRFVVLLSVALLLGCGARGEVLKDKVIAKVDSMLGELDVKKKEVELSVAQLKTSRNELAKGKITVEVKAEQLGESVKGIEEKIADADGSLKTLRDHLASEADVEIAGKTYTNEQLKAMADKVIAARKSLTSQLESLNRSKTMLEGRATKIDAMLTDYDKRLAALQIKMGEIDASSVALKAMKDTSGIGEGDATFSDNFTKVEGQVNDLYASLETELRYESASFDQASLDKDLGSVDEFISATKGEGSTIAEIDKILGEKSRPAAGNCIMAILGSRDDARTSEGCLACVVALGLLAVTVSCCGGIVVYWLLPRPDQPPVAAAQPQRDEFHAKYDAWKLERENLRLTVSQLERDKQDLVRRLKEMGVSSSDELSADNPQARVLAIELVEIDKQIRAVRQRSQAYDAAIDRLESVLRRADRKQMIDQADVTDDQFLELSATVSELDQKLRDESQVSSAVGDLRLDSDLDAALRTEPSKAAP